MSFSAARLHSERVRIEHCYEEEDNGQDQDGTGPDITQPSREQERGQKTLDRERIGHTTQRSGQGTRSRGDLQHVKVDSRKCWSTRQRLSLSCPCGEAPTHTYTNTHTHSSLNSPVSECTLGSATILTQMDCFLIK